MDTQRIQEQIEEISQEENIPAALTSLCGLYLSAMGNLKGEILDRSFLKILDETCKGLKLQEGRLRIATILDVILATSFYYKKAHLWSFNRKEYRTSFALLLWEGYNQLMDWYEVGGEEDYERVSYSDKLFDEFLLETSRTDFSRFDLWRNAIKQYRIVSKYGLQRLDSRLKNIFDKHPRESFVFSNRVWGNFYLFTLVSTVLSGGLVLFTLLHLFYKFYVVKPYYLLLVGEGITNYRPLLGELSIVRQAFWEKGLFVFGDPLWIFLCGALVLLVIEIVQDKWGWKILFVKKYQ